MADYFFTGTGHTTASVQIDTITQTGTYKITATGAAGGSSTNVTTGMAGGAGAQVIGDIFLTAGETLDIFVGEQGASARASGGGGGGTYIYEPNSGGGIGTLIAVAGGGGGAGYDGAGAPGQPSSGGGMGGGTSGGLGGTKGAGGQGGRSGGGGGGGYTGGNGAPDDYTGSTGLKNGTDFAGGAPTTSGGYGGYGGGGGGGFSGGGGGGGYGGGGGGGNLDYGSSSTGDGGGGGGSYANTALFTGTPKLQAGTNTGNGEVTITFLCYLRGTRILTPSGKKPIEALTIGDAVITRFNGIRPIKWIGRQTFNNSVTSLSGEHNPVKIHANALGPNRPARDLSISPGHSMLIENTLVLAKSLVNGITITQTESPDVVEYYQLDLGTHDCLRAEGTWSESFADGPDGTQHGLRGTFHNVEEYYQLFPDEPPATELILCAPRHLNGPALEAILAPIASRASAQTQPGALEGWVESVTAGRHIEGWAIDTANPFMQVPLDIYLGDRHLGTTLACNHRDDLQKAGKGRGHCAFRFTSPIKLTPSMIPTLRVHHAQDFTAQLPLSTSLTTPSQRLVN